jgi:hypothetical protein
MLVRYKKVVWLVGVVAAILIGFLVFQSLQFRVVETTPNNKNYPAALGDIDIIFSKELDKPLLEERIRNNMSEVVFVDFESTVTATVLDKTLRLTFSQTPMPGDYQITLKGIQSAGGQTLDINLPFIVKDIPYEDMTKEERALFDAAAANSGEDSFDEYPVLAKLPYETANYKIGYRFEHDTDPAPMLIITMKFFEPGSNAIPATEAERQTYLSDIRKYRNEALEWLKSQGATYDKYSLEYTEPDLQGEFPTGKGRFFDGEGDIETDHPEG